MPAAFTVSEEVGVKITSFLLPGVRLTVPAEVVAPVKTISAEGAVNVAVSPVVTFNTPLFV